MIRAAQLSTVVLTILVSQSGCLRSLVPTARPQAADDLAEKLATTNVGDKTTVSNTEPIQVSAVGLVWKLPGTGSVGGGEWRPMLERDLRKKKLNPKQFLEDSNKSCSLVLVSALIPPGARKGDSIDVDVVLPQGSQTASLKGGVLFECDLSTSEQSANVRETLIRNGADVGANPVTSNTLLVGKTLVRAEGPLVAGSDGSKASVKATILGEDELPAQTSFTLGRVWGGGRVLEDRPYWLVLNEKDQNSRMALEIAARLNTVFQPGGDIKNKTANAITKEVVTLTVPTSYRLNHARFLLVSRNVPLVPSGSDSLYRKKLEQDLLEPGMAITAAIKLEALGAESTQALRVGLQSDSPWVRFASAEGLAYLGSTAGVGELARLAEIHPALRSHCLTALATLDDGVSTDRLVDLMAHPDPSLRYGAFVALRSANENHAALNGSHIKKTFWVHTVAPESQGLVHLTSTRRSEIVLFGTTGQLVPPFSMPLGKDFVVSAKATDTEATIMQIVPTSTGSKEYKVKSRLNLAAVLTTLGEMGAGYSEAVEFVKKSDTARVLTSSVAIDATPRGMPLPVLAELARTDTTLERANLDVAKAVQGTDILQAVLNLPSNDPEPKAKPVDVPQLNRNPGRIFTAKKHPSEPDDDFTTFKQPTTGTEADPDLARNPGKLFGR